MSLLRCYPRNFNRKASPCLTFELPREKETTRTTTFWQNQRTWPSQTALLSPGILKLRTKHGNVPNRKGREASYENPYICEITTLTGSTQSTVIENNVSKDACPDLTLTKCISQAEWKNTNKTRGRDHYTLATTISMKRNRHR